MNDGICRILHLLYETDCIDMRTYIEVIYMSIIELSALLDFLYCVQYNTKLLFILLK